MLELFDRETNLRKMEEIQDVIAIGPRQGNRSSCRKEGEKVQTEKENSNRKRVITVQIEKEQKSPNIMWWGKKYETL